MGKLEGQTFAEAEGTPANQHMKKLAKATSALKKNIYGDNSKVADPMDKLKMPTNAFFYPNGFKIYKCIVKHQGTYVVYVGQLDRHNKKKNSADLIPLIKVWKKNGIYIEGQSNIESKIVEVREKLPAIDVQKKLEGAQKKAEKVAAKAARKR